MVSLLVAAANSSFAFATVVSIKALSLFIVFATCCKPIVMLIRLWTFSITFCKFSFSPANNATAPCAALNAPTTPLSPEIIPCNPRLSWENIRACVVASPIASVSRPASCCNFLKASVPRCPLASKSASSSRTLRSWVRSEICVLTFFSAASFCFFNAFSSCRSWSAEACASLISFSRRVISDCMFFAASV